MEKTRLRIRFTKQGDLRWISHRDLARVWERLLRRANLQLAFSEGFHPKPRISFPSALALGIEALDEVVELEIVGSFNLNDIERDIRREMPAGMVLLSLEELKSSLGKAKILGATYRIELPASLVDPKLREELDGKLRELQQAGTVEIQRDGKTIVCQTTDSHFGVAIEGEALVFSLPSVAQGSVRPSEWLDYLGLGHLLEEGITLQRTAVHIQESSQHVETT
jgi:radical SAM-linked protein